MSVMSLYISKAR